MWRDEAFLLDILLAAKELRQFTAGVSYESFSSDRLLQHAVMRLIEIIGEAARNISPDFKDAHPEIAWASIVGMRHRLAHEYFRVAPDKVWEVVQRDLPELVALIQPLVPPEEPAAEKD